jgi:hypothetical protein
MSLFNWWRRWVNRHRPGRQARAGLFRPMLEPLEARQLLSVFTINSTEDTDILPAALGNGTGEYAPGKVSLRSAISEINYEHVAATIDFSIGSGVQTITTSGLAAITVPITIDGTTQPGFNAAPRPLIELEAGSGASTGLMLDGSDSTVRGLVIHGFSFAGISVASNHNLIEGNYLGTDVSGTIALPNGVGVNLSYGSTGCSGNTIGGLTPAARNIISGNSSSGISVNPGATGNVIEGNYIGTDVTGTAKLGNLVGVAVTALDTTIGGTTATARNLISGNHSSGVGLAGGSGNVVEGNFIGTDVTGTATLGNTGDGISDGAPFTTIGGSMLGAGNVISGNGGNGISFPPFSADNSVTGNFIGTDVTGTVALGNALDGVLIVNGHGIAVGGVGAAARNLISSNGGNGVSIILGQNRGNLVAGNFIGTDVTGTTALGNAGSGVLILSTPNNLIGGTAAGAGNTISGNRGNGIVITGATSTANSIQGNFIGTDGTGTTTTDGHGMALGNSGNGVLIDGAPSNAIGGTLQGSGNVISGNTGDGILIRSSGTSAITIQGNFIGTDLTGQAALPNLSNGVEVAGVPGTTIGGSAAGAVNVIAGNAGDGIYLHGSGATGTTVQGNYIGTNASQAETLGNGRYGVYVSTSQNVIGAPVGSTDQSLGNWIAFNGQQDPMKGDGVAVVVGNQDTIRLNHIFKNKRLGIDLGDDFFDRYDPTRFGTGGNNHQWHPTIVAVDADGRTIHWMLNAPVTGTYTIDVYSDPGNNYLDYAEGQTWLASPTLVLTHGHFEFTTTVGTSKITATATDAQGNTSEFSLAEQNGDGLCDTWKANGYIDLHGNGTHDVELPGAHLASKDVYVEYDSMTGWGPVAGVLDSLQAVFAAHGISLHLDAGNQEITPRNFGTSTNQVAWPAFQTVKQANFANHSGPGSDAYGAKLLAYRYCIFGRNYNGTTSSGLAEILGNDCMVTLGGWFGVEDDGHTLRTAAEQDAESPAAHAEVVAQQAGTFLHEFGHTLGLSHIGPVNWDGTTPRDGLAAVIEQDPEYRSVMNYLYQVPGSSAFSGTQILDYSETHPNEWANLWFAFQENPQSLAGSDTSSATEDETNVFLAQPKASPTFSGLTSSTVVVGTASTLLSGTLRAPSAVPVGATLTLTAGTASITATVQADGTFSASLPTAALPVGSYTISYQYAGSADFNAASGSGSLRVTYGIAVEFDNSRPVNPGATLPIELLLTDAAGNNLSSAALTVHADYLVRVGDPSQTHLEVQAPGNSQPGNNFNYTSGEEHFNLKTTTSMAAGTYELFFSIAGDPIEHFVSFVVR